MAEEKKVLLSVRDLEVKFHVRGRILTAIRGINLDIYENESIAIVGESGSGKSVFTKTFAGMLDSNGFISNGSVVFNDDEVSDTHVTKSASGMRFMARCLRRLNEYAHLIPGADLYKRMLELEAEKKAKATLTDEQDQEFTQREKDLVYERTETLNAKMTYDSKTQKQEIKEAEARISDLDKQIEALHEEKKALIRKHKLALAADTRYLSDWNHEMSELRARYREVIAQPVPEETKKLNELISKEIFLSIGRYKGTKRTKAQRQLLKELKKAMRFGLDLSDTDVRSKVFDTVVLYVRYLDETPEKLHGTCVLNLAKIKYADDWTQIRGSKIAMVFQDPMTSLNPIITIGKQITSVILKHQNCSELEARARAMKLMKQVGIPNAEQRFDDYPFQYSGGMRQRIVIAIALSCQPKILICDEPTTALDVTIQAQILDLLKELQKEYHYTIVFITHDLGVVANVADRVAVLYAGQIVELGMVDEIFNDPRHPYTWALLSSLPQLAQKGTVLYSINGTPPSLYNKITGDAFAPRNPYCMKIDTIAEPPMFKITDTHYAKTWLLDPRAPKVQKPELIENIHEKLIAAFNI